VTPLPKNPESVIVSLSNRYFSNMKHFFTVCLAVLTALCAFGPSAFAQAGETRTVPLVVIKSTGQIVTGLTAEDIGVRGLKATVRSIALDTGPRHIILLFDTSGSMAEGDHPQKLLAAKRMAKTFLERLPAQDFVALDVFAQTEKQIVPFTHDFVSIADAIDSLPEPKDTTAPGDALSSALREMGSKLSFGDSVIFFSDGEFATDKSRTSLHSLIPDLERRGIRTFLELTPAPESEGLPEEEYFASVRDAADFMATTGGYSFAPWVMSPISGLQVLSARSAEYQMAALRDSVQGTYRVELYVGEPLRKKQRLEVKVSNGKSKAMHNLFLFYPRELYPN